MASRRQKATAQNQADRGVEVLDDDNEACEQRYGWLLRPIRDLAQNWTIDIADELGKYLEELGHVEISVGEAMSRRKMNFAEAALLIQGTVGVYSKKVEYLYQLCHELLQTLERQNGANNRQPRGHVDGDNGHEQDAIPALRRAADFDEDFLPLDDIPVCRDIDSKDDDDGHAVSRIALLRPPMPLSLVPLEDFEKSKMLLINTSGKALGRRDDFWMNTAKIHPGTGALLLDACNAGLVDVPSSIGTFVPCGINRSFIGLNIDVSPNTSGADAPSQCSPDTPKAPGQRAQEPAPEAMPAAETTFGAGDDDGGGFDDFGHGEAGTNFDPVMAAAATVADPPPLPNRSKRFGILPSPKTKKRKTQKEILLEICQNPWQELDADPEENDTADGIGIGIGYRKKQFKQTRSTRIPNAGVPTNSGPGDTHPILLPEQPVGDFLDVVGVKQPRKSRNESWKRIGCSALSDSYFNDQKCRGTIAIQRRAERDGDETFNAGTPPNKKRRQSETDQVAQEREDNISRNLHLLFDGADDGGEPDDDNDAVGDMSSADVQMPGFDDNDAGPSATFGFDAVHADNDAGPENVSYEEMVKMRLQLILLEAEKNMATGELTRRVQEWEAKIAPTLQEDENRPQFDIHGYGTKLLEFFDEEDEETYSITDFAKKQPAWETCRYFLASLMLANTGNVEISTSGEEGTEECLDTMTLTLLTKERHHEQLDEYAAPSARDN